MKQCSQPLIKSEKMQRLVIFNNQVGRNPLLPDIKDINSKERFKCYLRKEILNRNEYFVKHFSTGNV